MCTYRSSGMSAFFPVRTVANPFVIKYKVVVRGNGAVYDGHSGRETSRRKSKKFFHRTAEGELHKSKFAFPASSKSHILPKPFTFSAKAFTASPNSPQLSFS